MNVPTAVVNAVKSFDTTGSVFSLVPPRQSERSLIFKWGVRVEHETRDEIGWICLGGPICRENWRFYPLHGGKLRTQRNT